MRIFCFVAMVMALGSCGKDDVTEHAIPCIPGSLGSHVLAFYPFSNGTLNDISGNNQDLTNTTTASPSEDRSGNMDCAYEFDNLPTSGEYLFAANTNFLNGLGEFSVSLWFYPQDTTRSGGIFEGLINRDLGFSCPDRNGQWSVGLFDCRRVVFGRTNSVWDNRITNFNCQQEINMRTEVWHHVVATFSQNGPQMNIYRNGILQESATGMANCGSGAPTYQDFGDLFMGKDYTGRIDDVIIFNKVLSQQDVMDLFHMEACCY